MINRQTNGNNSFNSHFWDSPDFPPVASVPPTIVVDTITIGDYRFFQDVDGSLKIRVIPTGTTITLVTKT